jgi:hypothetical protein
MNGAIKIMIAVSVFVVSTAAGIFPGAGQGHAVPAAGEKGAHQTQNSSGQLVLRYAEALATGGVETWAKLDLGCLAKQRRSTKGGSVGMAESEAKACWDETMRAHVAMVADEPEAGIFGAMGRGIGFGLISETHRQADRWKDYPPGVFLSPAVVAETTPRLNVAKVWPTRPIAIQGKGEDPVAVRGTMVELHVTYPDPLTAPLALKPDEVWWASGQIRRYGPVREVLTRFVVVTGLRKLGYSSDTAVVNEALADAPRIPATRYGLNPEIGRAFNHRGDSSAEPPIKGGLVLGSARWWTKQEGAERFRASVERVKHLPSQGKRLALLRRLLLLDPNDTEANAMIGAELFQTLLGEGLSKSGINAPDDAVKHRLAELFWNIQAATWRQELTAVATGYEPAADALYGAIASLEIAVGNGPAPPETRRHLGALYRWNGDAEAALALHEGLFQEAPETDHARRGALLSDMAWDRIQWLAWNRRYDHPWVGQANREAEQALELVEDPLDKLVAAQALLTLEALSRTRTPDSVHARVRLVKQWHDRLPGALGVWGHLVGNELVKALVPEGTQVTLPTPVRSPEVLDVAVHSNPPAQDLLRAWDFDHEHPGTVPRGLVAVGPARGNRGDWVVVTDPQAPTAPHVLAHHAVCPAADCVHMLLTEEAIFDYVDVTVQLRLGEGQQGRAGIAVGGRDGGAVYSATVDHDVSGVAIHRVEQGQATLLGAAAIKPRPGAWHVLRIQRENYANVSRPRLALFFDGVESLAVSDEPIRHGGRVGLITMGTGTARFDGFHIMKLVSNEPLSQPAAY